MGSLVLKSSVAFVSTASVLFATGLSSLCLISLLGGN